MSSRDRINLFPSTANLVLMKQRIVSAQTGLNLLKRKRDALEIHLRQFSLELKQQHENLDVVMRDAMFSMAKAKFLGADFKPVTVIKPTLADVYLRKGSKKIIGLKIPTLELVMQQNNALIFGGLNRGGQQVQIVREKFQEALKVIVSVASLKYSVSAIGAAIKQNNMRINGLEYVLLPRYQNTMVFIRDELDELGREEFYRLKRSQAKQIKKKSEFMKMSKKRDNEIYVQSFGSDFSHTHLATSIEINLSAKPIGGIEGPRKTIYEIRDKTVIFKTQEQKPVIFDEPIVKEMPRKMVSIKVPKVRVVTSSSSSSDSLDSLD